MMYIVLVLNVLACVLLRVAACDAWCHEVHVDVSYEMHECY